MFSLKFVARETKAIWPAVLLVAGFLALACAMSLAVHLTAKALSKAVEAEGKGLLGADLIVIGHKTPPSETVTYLKSIGASLAYDNWASASVRVDKPVSSSARVLLRGVSPEFPFYGTSRTIPMNVWPQLHTHPNAAIIDSALAKRFELHPGSTFRIFDTEFSVLAIAAMVPGEPPPLFTATQPRVYLTDEVFSRLTHTNHVRTEWVRLLAKLPPDEVADYVLSEMRERIVDDSAIYRTADKTSRDVKVVFNNVESFLTLVSVACFVLGVIGLVNVLTGHLRKRAAALVVLKNIGATSSQCITIGMLHVLMVAILGTLLGSVGGGLLHLGMVTLITDLLPFPVAHEVAARAISENAALMFSIICLVGSIPAMRMWRGDKHQSKRSGLGLAMLGLAILLPFVLICFYFRKIVDTDLGLILVGACIIAIGSFMVLSKGFLVCAKLAARAPVHSFPARHAIANLTRPGTKSTLVLTSIGLGTCFVLTVMLIQQSLVRMYAPSDDDEAPNIIVQDLETAQIPVVSQAISEAGGSNVTSEPVTRIALLKINGKELVPEAAQRILKQAKISVSSIKATGRGYLTHYEVERAGSATALKEKVGAPRVAVASNLAKALNIQVGDTITFDVAAVPISTVVGCIFTQARTKLSYTPTVVFSAAVSGITLDRSWVYSRARDDRTAKDIESRILQACNTATVIDVSEIQEITNDIGSRVGRVFQIMSGGVLLTSAITMLGLILATRDVRKRDLAILSILGATRTQVFLIQILEFMIVSAVGTALGSFFALGGDTLLRSFVFTVSTSENRLWIWEKLTILALGTALLCCIGLIRPRSAGVMEMLRHTD